eukprot:Pgem_evm1s6841
MEKQYPDGSITCDNVREDILDCMIKTHCMHVEKKTAHQCFREGKAPPECQNLMELFSRCKAEQVIP